ncbi:flagellar export chaperone FliS [Priestia filamentosa]|uniref:Flagellar secretion chaperone FliS n=1 Tax=Priestia filamentosa TaxID=1402861 RepID=A0A0H4KM75_9BACI|nr:flagellar export chaperone FliS [Priestia filamentosa]AKO95202.1 flagellar export chaperone FliS [Priestia filamentosa]MDT3765022.1 flagellar export chaperone FliS [Priestia filamentosa]OXS66844.1 flagellar protein FliS [Priestia filamentosa]RJS67556.1 flagella export chaperone FliS [Priestia filamentosa]WCM17929.1 flagellar export chaperone FliS [Priestia filamentosa]
MTMNNAYQAYQQGSVNTATPGELTLMLYNGCLKFIRRAKTAIENREVEEKNKNLIKAQNIITELMVTLRTGSELSDQMRTMYDYINQRLMKANIESSVDILEEVESYVMEFRDTWKEVIQKTRSSKGYDHE